MNLLTIQTNDASFFDCCVASKRSLRGLGRFLQIMALAPILLDSVIGVVQAQPREGRFDRLPLTSSFRGGSLESIASESTASTYLPSLFSVQYFSKLNTNFGLNNDNTCGYLALSMLLTFWDSYWCDDFVPSIYEADTIENANSIESFSESPGTAREPAYSGNNSAEYYQTIVVPNSDHCLQSALIKDGDEWIDYFDGYNTGYLGIDELYDLIGAYHENINPTLRYSIAHESSTLSKPTIVNYVQRGIPVIVALSADFIHGHYAIAYDYDVTSDTLYYHSGYDDETHITAESINYPIISAYYAIEPTDHFPHSCTENYWNVATGDAICPCSMPTHLSNHQHSYTSSFDEENSMKHRAYCSCGDSILQLHTWGPTERVGGSWIKTCTGCLKTVNVGTGPIIAPTREENDEI